MVKFSLFIFIVLVFFDQDGNSHRSWFNYSYLMSSQLSEAIVIFPLQLVLFFKSEGEGSLLLSASEVITLYICRLISKLWEKRTSPFISLGVNLHAPKWLLYTKFPNIPTVAKIYKGMTACMITGDQFRPQEVWDQLFHLWIWLELLFLLLDILGGWEQTSLGYLLGSFSRSYLEEQWDISFCFASLHFLCCCWCLHCQSGGPSSKI